MKKKDLLPVVIIDKRRATTSSLEVANIFAKKHKNVLRDIENLDTSSAFHRLNFEPVFHRDSYDREQKMYQICKDGFVFLVMGYRGQAAAEFKEAYIGEFNRREAEILRLRTVLASNKQNIELQEVRTAGKVIRRDETDAIKQFVEYAASQGSRNSNRYYMILSKMSNQALFDASQKFKNVRDVCDAGQLGTLRIADMIIKRALLENMGSGLYYKEIYKNAKAKVQQFVELYGKSEVPGTILQIGRN